VTQRPVTQRAACNQLTERAVTSCIVHLCSVLRDCSDERGDCSARLRAVTRQRCDWGWRLSSAQSISC